MDKPEVATLIEPFEEWMYASKTFTDATAYQYVSAVRRLLRAASSPTLEALQAANETLPRSFRAKSGIALRHYAAFLQRAAQAGFVISTPSGTSMADVVAALSPPQAQTVKPAKRAAGPTIPYDVAVAVETLRKLLTKAITHARWTWNSLPRGYTREHSIGYQSFQRFGLRHKSSDAYDILAASKWVHVRQTGKENELVVFDALPLPFPLEEVRPAMHTLLTWGGWATTETVIAPLVPRAPRNEESWTGRELRRMVPKVLLAGTPIETTIEESSEESKESSG